MILIDNLKDINDNIIKDDQLNIRNISFFLTQNKIKIFCLFYRINSRDKRIIKPTQHLQNFLIKNN